LRPALFLCGEQVMLEMRVLSPLQGGEAVIAQVAAGLLQSGF